MTDRPQHRSTSVHVATMIGARMVAAVLSAITGLVVPRVLEVPDYAHYGIAVGIAGMLVVLSDLGLTTSVARYLAEGRVDRPLVTRAAMLRFGAAALAGLALAGYGMLIDAGIVGDDAGMVPAYLYLAGGLVFSSSMLGVAMGLLPTLRRMRALLALTVAQPLLELAGLLVVVGWGFGAGGIIVASALAALLTGTVGLVVVLRHVPLRAGVAAGTSAAAAAAATGREAASRVAGAVDLAMVRAYSRAMFVVAVCFTVFGQVDQLVLYHVRGPEEAAGYIANWRLITLLHMPGLAAATVIAPRLAGGGAAGRALYLRWLALLGAGYAGMVAIAVALAPSLVPLALGDRYRAAAGIFVALGVYALLLGVAPLVTMAANFLGGARRRVRLSVVTIIVNVVLDLLLVPRYGVWGAALATTVAFSWYVGAHAVLSFRLLDGRLGALPVPGRIVAAGTLGVVACAGIAAGIASRLPAVLEPLAGHAAATIGAGAIAAGAYAGLLWVGVLAYRWGPERRPVATGAAGGRELSEMSGGAGTIGALVDEALRGGAGVPSLSEQDVAASAAAASTGGTPGGDTAAEAAAGTDEAASTGGDHDERGIA